MPEMLCTGAVLTCTFGDAPSIFEALPLPAMLLQDGALPVAAIDQIIPFLNIMPFVMCNSPENPEVIAATAAAMGVFTPMPCIPVPIAPWEPQSVVSIGDGIPLATAMSKCECAWGGVIGVDLPVEGPATTD